MSYLVAVDDGYAQAKLYGDGPNGLVKNMVRSSIKSGKHIASIGGGYIGAYTTEEGETFTISNNIEGESTRFDGFHVSPMNRALVNHVLMASGFSGLNVALVTGVPMETYFINGQKNERLLNLKEANLMKGVQVSSGGHPPVIESVRVFAQGAAAWMDCVVDDDLNEIRDPSLPMAIIDIGGRTTDICTIRDGEQIVYEKSGTANVGALDVYKHLEKKIRSKFDNDDDISSIRLDKAVRTGFIDMFGKNVDISEMVKESIGEIEGRIVREIQRKIGKASDLSAVVMVGGGSRIFKSIHTHFPHNGEMSDDPEYCNARGLYKYAKMFSEE